jgi:hypothetical protein
LSWEKARDKWLARRVEPEVDLEDVRSWLEKDEMWSSHGCRVTFTPNRGSHFARVYIQHMSKFSAKWSADSLDLCHTKGRRVKKWLIDELCEAYRELKGLDED